MRRRIAWAVLMCVLGAPAEASEELRIADAIGRYRENGGADRIYRAIVDSEVDFDSDADTPPIFFEAYFTFSLTGNAKVCSRAFFDFPLGTPVMVHASQGVFQIEIATEATVFSLDASGDWLARAASPWQYVTLPESQPYLRMVVPGRDRPRIRLAASRHLGDFVEAHPARVEWIQSVGTLQIEKGNGVLAFVNIRTPNDQKLFGELLSEISIKTRNGLWMIHRSLVTSRESPLVFRFQRAEIEQKLSAIDRRADSTPITPLPGITPALVPRVMMFEKLHLLPCQDSRRVSRPSEFGTRYEEAIQEAMGYGSQAPKLKSATQLADDERILSTSLAEELGICRLAVETAVAGRGGFVDDAAILWLGLERTLYGAPADHLWRVVAKRLLDSRMLSLEEKIGFAMSFGDLGAPPWLWNEGYPLSGPDREFLSAVLAARWGKPPGPNQAEACQKIMSDDSQPLSVRAAAVDSLVRWDLLDRVDAALVLEWLKDRVSGTPATRNSALKALSRQPQGRQLLLRCVRGEQALDAAALAEAKRMLLIRARATLETQRFDFMTEAECQEIVDLCNANKGGPTDRSSR